MSTSLVSHCLADLAFPDIQEYLTHDDIVICEGCLTRHELLQDDDPATAAEALHERLRLFQQLIHLCDDPTDERRTR